MPSSPTRPDDVFQRPETPYERTDPQRQGDAITTADDDDADGAWTSDACCYMLLRPFPIHVPGREEAHEACDG